MWGDLPRKACTSVQDSWQVLMFEGKTCSHSRAFTSCGTFSPFCTVLWLGKSESIPPGKGMDRVSPFATAGGWGHSALSSTHYTGSPVLCLKALAEEPWNAALDTREQDMRSFLLFSML